jgi:hypothetical protein
VETYLAIARETPHTKHSTMQQLHALIFMIFMILQCRKLVDTPRKFVGPEQTDEL